MNPKERSMDHRDILQPVELRMNSRWWRMINCFYEMVDRRKWCQKFLPLQTPNTPKARFELAFRLCWMKLCSIGNHHTTAPQIGHSVIPQKTLWNRKTSCESARCYMNLLDIVCGSIVKKYFFLNNLTKTP